MNIARYIPIALAVATFGLLLTGCVSDPNRVGITNRNQPGPAVGQALGTGVGAVGGNVARCDGSAVWKPIARMQPYNAACYDGSIDPGYYTMW